MAHRMGLLRIARKIGSTSTADRRNQGRAAVSGAGDINHVEIVFIDDPVQVDVNKILTGRGSPVPQQQRLDIANL